MQEPSSLKLEASLPTNASSLASSLQDALPGKPLFHS